MSRPAGEFLDHAFVDPPLERHDQVRKVLHRLPAPLDEFRLVAAGGVHDVDLALVAGEAQREPLLHLPAILALPSLPDDFARDVIDQPVVDRGEMPDRLDVGFLIELAQGARVGVFAAVEAALRHLPDMRQVDVLGAVDAPADEHAAVAVEHGRADAGAVGQVFEAGHGSGTVVGCQGSE